MPSISPRQAELYAAEGRIIMAVGSVRSGKTFAGALAFTDYFLTTPPEKQLVSGRSPSELRGEVMPQIRDRGLAHGCVVRWNASRGILSVDRHDVYFMAWTNEASADRIRGMTFGTALLDEVTLVDVEFYNMLLSRLSRPWRRLYGLTNTDHPEHWLKRRIDDGRVDQALTFTFKDNPSLDPDYVAELHRMYPAGSLFHRRFILGEWVAPTGLIYTSTPARAEPPQGRVVRTFAGCDFGMTAPTSVVRVAEYDHVGKRSWWITHSLHVEGNREKSSRPHEQSAQIAQFHLAHPFEVVYVDPSAAALSSELREALPCAVVNADNDVAHGIATVQRLFSSGELTIRDDLETRPLRNELAAYIWHEKKQDTPDADQRDHHCDALRYAMHTAVGGRSGLVF